MSEINIDESMVGWGCRTRSGEAGVIGRFYDSISRSFPVPVVVEEPSGSRSWRVSRDGHHEALCIDHPDDIVEVWPPAPPAATQIAGNLMDSYQLISNGAQFSNKGATSNGGQLKSEEMISNGSQFKNSKEISNGAKPSSAASIMRAGLAHMDDRAQQYDTPQGERSMSATVEAFRAVTGVEVTETQGWMFMALLKAVRSQKGAFHLDSYEDGAAYFALAGEAASQREKDVD